MSTPASMAFSWLIEAMPEVKWLCRWIGSRDGGLQRLDQRVGVVRRDQAGHVLDADRVGAHGLQFLRLADVVLEVVYTSPPRRGSVSV